jgi:hypothetical protein
MSACHLELAGWMRARDDGVVGANDCRGQLFCTDNLAEDAPRAIRHLASNGAVLGVVTRRLRI